MVHPTIEQMLECAHLVSLPLMTPFRGITTREMMIFDAPDGVAEWSPFGEYDDEESSTWLRGTLEHGWGRAQTPTPQNPAATIGVNGTLPALPASEVQSFLATLGAVRTLKIKVAGPGSSLESDAARVRVAREFLGPTGRIRLDANGAWTLDEAEHAIRAMESLDIDYVEQPVESLADLAELRRRVTRLGIQIAADESIRRWSDVHQVIESKACDIVVVKVAPLGGITRTLGIVEAATHAGLEVVVSSAVESSVGIYQGALLWQILLETYGTALDAGLGTVSFFESDVVMHPLLAHDGKLTIATPVLDHAALETYAMAPERAVWWRDRLRRCRDLV
jgi:O-succinylbenzoate synthase